MFLQFKRERGRILTTIHLTICQHSSGWWGGEGRGGELVRHILDRLTVQVWCELASFSLLFLTSPSPLEDRHAHPGWVLTDSGKVSQPLLSSPLLSPALPSSTLLSSPLLSFPPGWGSDCSSIWLSWCCCQGSDLQEKLLFVSKVGLLPPIQLSAGLQPTWPQGTSVPSTEPTPASHQGLIKRSRW